MLIGYIRISHYGTLYIKLTQISTPLMMIFTFLHFRHRIEINSVFLIFLLNFRCKNTKFLFVISKVNKIYKKNSQHVNEQLFTALGQMCYNITWGDIA